ncbi:hypothetical protein ES692_08765 [Psychroserpens burtonensis]|uniref:DUF6705 domain-containing protein n=1 Tax=Psychroserpens burtonensis TaxID=49278 RepID=A0A5C7B6W7_9FLAO|nr:DUF6705 family protein [Psychroserpens burtonensis]TXE17646.1 hypothetical protein ES692_08765 [Psychroserpens burtonensis]
MKNLFFAILFLLLALSCKAQSPILSLDTYEHQIPDNAYVKDLNNELNKFAGTWIFSQNNITFTITLQKQEQTFNGDYYEDYIIGEYAYLINTLEIINTLSSLQEANATNNSQTNENIIEYLNIRNIGGRYLENGQDSGCNDCSENERVLELYLVDPDRKYLSTSLILRYLVNENNPEKMTATIRARTGVAVPIDGFTSPRVPYGTYLMEKQ